MYSADYGVFQLATTTEAMQFGDVGNSIPFYGRLELESLLVEICKYLPIKVRCLIVFVVKQRFTKTSLQVQISHQDDLVAFEPVGDIPEDGEVN